MTTIREVLEATMRGTHPVVIGRVEEALLAREDNIADTLRMTGVESFGLEPAIIAEVLTEVGLGTPPSTEARAEIHNQFHATIERLRREMGGGS